MSTRPDLFASEEGWADSREATLIRSRRLAWMVAAVTLAIALIEAVTIAWMMPLRTLVPIAVMVDRTTGFVERVNLDQTRQISADEALRRAMLAQYVMAREAYDPPTLRDSFRRVTLWSSPASRDAYVAAIQAARRNGRPDRTVAQVKSVSFPANGSALVRFDLIRSGADGRPRQIEPRIAILTYYFSDATMSVADRFDNPLGFQVLSYRTDGEATPRPWTTGSGLLPAATVATDPGGAS